MNENKNKIIIGLGIIAVIVIIAVTVSIKNAKNKEIADSVGTKISENTVNNVTTEGNAKINTSEQLASDKKIENIKIENSKLVYDGKTSKLTAKVTNDEIVKDNLRFKIKFIANDGTVLAETVGLIGKIGANESKYIDANITIDVTNAKDISYEIIK